MNYLKRYNESNNEEDILIDNYLIEDIRDILLGIRM